MVILLSVIFGCGLYVLAMKRGMPTKRWLVIGSLLGPLALLMFNLHYRRAFRRCIGFGSIVWRP